MNEIQNLVKEQLIVETYIKVRRNNLPALAAIENNWARIGRPNDATTNFNLIIGLQSIGEDLLGGDIFLDSDSNEENPWIQCTDASGDIFNANDIDILEIAGMRVAIPTDYLDAVSEEVFEADLKDILSKYGDIKARQAVMVISSTTFESYDQDTHQPLVKEA